MWTLRCNKLSFGKQLGAAVSLLHYGKELRVFSPSAFAFQDIAHVCLWRLGMRQSDKAARKLGTDERLKTTYQFIAIRDLIYAK